MTSGLFDPRSSLYQSSFEKGLPFAAFVATGSDVHAARWNESYQRISLTPEQRIVIGQFGRTMRILCIAGTWCGDCARQAPMLQHIAEASSTIEVRFLDNKANEDLANELRIHGASRVPVAVFLSEDYFEVGRYGDKTLSAYRRKAARELGPSCDAGLVPPSPEELTIELSEWLAEVERLQLLLRLSTALRNRYGD